MNEWKRNLFDILHDGVLYVHVKFLDDLDVVSSLLALNSTTQQEQDGCVYVVPRRSLKH